MFHSYSFIYKNTKTQKSNESLPSHFQPPLIAPPRYPYPRCPKPAFIMSHFAIWDIPFRLLGYPISPFGVYFRHICAQCIARFSVFHLRFRSKIYAFSLSIRKIDLAPFCIFAFLHFANAKLLPFGN